MQAGELDRRVQFQRRAEKDDGHGNPVSGDWETQFERWAKIKFMRGSESVLAARLEARQPAILTIRNSAEARQVTADWRIVELVEGRNGPVFNIRENPTRTDDRAWLEMLVETGVAT